MIVGLVSCYREGRLVRAAITSAAEAADGGPVVVFEGPTGEVPNPPVGHVSQLPSTLPASRLFVLDGEWPSDAHKRTAMLRYAEHRWGGHKPLWGVWVDGDEVLLNASLLPDWLDSAPADALSFDLPIVELDGSVGVTQTHVVRLDLIGEYLLSASQIRMKGVGTIVALANYPAPTAEYVERWQVMVDSGQQVIPGRPLPGAPTILHRSALRPADRRALRAHTHEPEWFEQAEREAGLSRVILP